MDMCIKYILNFYLEEQKIIIWKIWCCWNNEYQNLLKQNLKYI